ncbi:MAG TPA: hypothetical protein VJH95_06450 [Candidatus Nanoarchaeia archaeon]|nr:hypothetical protein [Candidatus Nanoarchaeia archaeon]
MKKLNKAKPKKFPYWLKGGVIAAVLWAVFSLVLLNPLNFISGSASLIDLLPGIVAFISAFLTLLLTWGILAFAIGAVIGLLYKKIIK